MTQQIFKVQRPIFAEPDEDCMILVYNKSQSIIGEFKATKELLDLMGDNPKIFVLADYNHKTSKLENITLTKYQGW